MDTNEKNAPAHEGAANRAGDGRPQNRNGRNRNRGRHGRGNGGNHSNAAGNNAPPNAAGNGNAVNTGNRSADRSADRPRNDNRGDNRGDNRSDNRATQTPPETDRRTGHASGRPSVGRPQRVPHRSSTPAALPNMDDLLIDDGLNAAIVAADTSPEDAPDAAEIERILENDFFARPNEPIPAVLPEGKVVIVGIRFRAGGKTYFFDPGEITCTVGQSAIVETARGLEFGEVYIPNRMMNESQVVPPLRPVIRIATEEDIRHNEENQLREEEAFRVGVQKINEHKLDMKLVAVQYHFDNSKLLFYFTSAKRVDFRELVKDLAGVFHIRIELRQIGIRDEARMIGGLGPCGRPLCCTTFLSDFGQVSMKMAKEQNLSLNSTKISGCCGRLMCCLRYEHEVYKEEMKYMPPVGSPVNTPDGPGTVTKVHLMQGEVKVSLRNQPDAAPKKYKRDQVKSLMRERRAVADTIPDEDMDEPDSDE